MDVLHNFQTSELQNKEPFINEDPYRYTYSCHGKSNYVSIDLYCNTNTPFPIKLSTQTLMKSIGLMGNAPLNDYWLRCSNDILKCNAEIFHKNCENNINNSTMCKFKYEMLNGVCMPFIRKTDGTVVYGRVCVLFV